LFKYFHQKPPGPNGPVFALFTLGAIALDNRKKCGEMDSLMACMKHGSCAK